MSALSRHRQAEDAGLVAPAVPELFHARTGWKRGFLSAKDADQYDAGYAQWPAPMPHVIALSTPYSTGWFDHEHDQQARDDARRER